MAGAGNRARHFLRVAGSDRSDRGPDLAVGSRRDVRGGNEIVEDDVFLTVQGNMHPDGDIPLTRHIHALHSERQSAFRARAMPHSGDHCRSDQQRTGIEAADILQIDEGRRIFEGYAIHTHNDLARNLHARSPNTPIPK
jgi:hypothetical protein